MRVLTSRIRTQGLALLLVPVFAYANLLCVAGGAPHQECADEDAGQHHEQSPTQRRNDCSQDSCFCLTMNTVATQTTVATPKQVVTFHALDFSFAEFPGILPVAVPVAYDHGPPEFLLVSSLSPRSPPVLA